MIPRRRVRPLLKPPPSRAIALVKLGRVPVLVREIARREDFARYLLDQLRCSLCPRQRRPAARDIPSSDQRKYFIFSSLSARTRLRRLFLLACSA